MAGRYMTDGEIIASYRQAKNKKKQIGILADLNGMTRAEIEDILIAAGFKIKRRPDPFRSKLTKKGKVRICRKWTAADDQTLIRMAKEGKPLQEICCSLGRSHSAVYERKRLWKNQGKI